MTDSSILQTPPSNRGLNLQIGLDWFSWTHTFKDIVSYTDFATELAAVFGDRFDWSEPRPVKYGQWYDFGFSSVLGIKTGYNLKEEGYIRCIFQIGGSILNSIPQRELLRFLAFHVYPLDGFCTRIDINADDHHTKVLAEVRVKIYDLYCTGESSLLSGFSKASYMSSGSIGGVQLETYYLGSRKSNRYVRVYDKLRDKTEENLAEEKRREEKRIEGIERREEKRREEMRMEEKRIDAKEREGCLKKEVKELRKQLRQKQLQQKREDRYDDRDLIAKNKKLADSVRLYYRWESEFKSRDADSVFRFMCEWYRGNCHRESIMEDIQGFLRDIIFTGYQFFTKRMNASLDRTNIICDWWAEFLELINHAAFKLPSVAPAKSIEKTVAWFERSVASSLEMVRRYKKELYWEWLESLYKSGAERLSKAQLLILELKGVKEKITVKEKVSISSQKYREWDRNWDSRYSSEVF